MFDYCLLIPSAAKAFFDNSNKITVLDGAQNMKESCRFDVTFRRVKDTTCACISSCFLSHDGQTGIGLESINCTDIPTKKKRRNHRLKFVIQIQDLLSHYLQSVDLTKNDGMTVKQLIKSAGACVDR